MDDELVMVDGCKKRGALGIHGQANKKAKRQTSPTSVASTGDVIMVSSGEDSVQSELALKLRACILRQRIARRLPDGELTCIGDSFCLGTIVSVKNIDDNVDNDVYRVAYDDGLREDVDSLTLFGMCTDGFLEHLSHDITDSLLLYIKSIPDFEDYDVPPPKEAADLVFRLSRRVRYFKYNLFEQAKAGLEVLRLVKRDSSDEIVFGTVMEHDNLLEQWQVMLDSGETISMYEDELREAGEAYTEHRDDDPFPMDHKFVQAHRDYAPDTVWDGP